MAKYFCAMCKQEKKDSEFTTFKRNSALKDRGYNCPICKSCASDYVQERGNTKEALKEVLRLQDIPYLEIYANTALETYEKKKKNTNLVIKKNIYSENEEVQGIETTKHQNTIYTCYSSKLGLMPKQYINFSFSDGLRSDVLDEKIKEENEEDKPISSAIKFLTKTFTKEIYDDKDKLAKAVKLKMDELSLHTNNTNTRQTKFKLKNHILALINADILRKEDYPFVVGEDEQKVGNDTITENTESVNTSNNGLNLPNDMNISDLQESWGMEYKQQDLIKFEKEYRNLRKNYEIKTASHDKFLKHACIASVKANECMAKNDVDGAKTWMTIFKDMTNAGKLQPSQMSKADLSGGLNNFSEFFKTVEQSKSVIDILPEMYETPRDKADFVVYCLVQYARRLKGLPDVEYKDVYKFYEEMEAQFVDDDEDIDFNSFFDDEEEGVEEDE